MAAYPTHESADANMLSRRGSEPQLECPSHSSTGLSTQQSALLPGHTYVGSQPQSAGLTEHVPLQQGLEEVGETNLLHQQVAAGTHNSSGSSACETLLSLCCCCQCICCTLPSCMTRVSVVFTHAEGTAIFLPDWTMCSEKTYCMREWH